jgi:hypothetical protein
MGYSCAVKAALVYDAISSLIGGTASNAMPDGGFHERSNVEHEDGAITGSVFKRVGILTHAERAARAAEMGPNCKPEWIGDPCRRAGAFKISSDGKIVRFPGLTKAQRAAAEQKGAALFTTRYGGSGFE